MDISDKPAFSKLLTTTMGAYSKPLPETAIVNVWWDLLERFPLPVVAAALTQYRHRESKFAPVPAAIEQICRCSDDRPDAEEAWTASLVAMDEIETVVWTEEMQAAFWIAHPALELGDEVAARMAFKQAYNRLVDEARSSGKPIAWSVTPGSNQERHRIVYLRNVEQGRLPAPAADSPLLLQGPGSPVETDHKGLAMVKAAVAALVPGSAKAEQRRQEEREQEAARKREIDQRVKEYEASESNKKHFNAA